MSSVFEDIFGAVQVGVVFVPVTCIKCGVTFGIELSMNRQLVKDGRDFSCPNGHRQHYIQPKTTEKPKEKK